MVEQVNKYIRDNERQDSTVRERRKKKESYKINTAVLDLHPKLQYQLMVFKSVNTNREINA